MKYILRYKNVTINTFGENRSDAEKFCKYLNEKHPNKIWGIEKI